jgi:alpha-N-arabinofuranosidase
VSPRDSQYGTIFLKVVNAAGDVQPIHITLNGVHGVLPTGKAVVLTSSSPQDTNTLGDPKKVVPLTKRAHDLGDSFDL